MTLRFRKSVATLAVLVGAGTTLAACGSESDEPGASGDTSQVGEDAGTELTEENFFAELTKAQQEAGTATVSMRLGAEGQSIEADGVVAIGEGVEDSAMQMTMEIPGQGQMEMRLVDGSLYMNLGPMSQDKFVAVDLDDESDPMARQFGGLTENFDPAAQLSAVEEAITGFSQTGDPEEIDGVEATPYEISVDPASVLESSGMAGQVPADALPEELTYTIYVGPDNLVRRMTMDVAGATTQLDYSGWGEDVTVEKPADDEISEQGFSELAGGGA